MGVGANPGRTNGSQWQRLDGFTIKTEGVTGFLGIYCTENAGEGGVRGTEEKRRLTKNFWGLEDFIWIGYLLLGS